MLEGPYPDWRDHLPPWGKHKTFDQQRKYVVNLAAETFRQPFRHAAELKEFRPKYHVPGRRSNGSPAGKRPIRWFFGRILLSLRNLVVAIVDLVTGGLLIDPSTPFRRSDVYGSADCAAVSLADANAADQQRVNVDPLWLTWSHRAALLCKVVAEPEVHLVVLWRAECDNLPAIDIERRRLTWQDGSKAVLDVHNWIYR